MMSEGQPLRGKCLATSKDGAGFAIDLTGFGRPMSTSRAAGCGRTERCFLLLITALWRGPANPVRMRGPESHPFRGTGEISFGWCEGARRRGEFPAASRRSAEGATPDLKAVADFSPNCALYRG